MLKINNNKSTVNEKKESISYSIRDEIDSILWLNENVALCKKLLSKLLSESKWWKLKWWADGIIYDLLVNRPEYAKLKLENQDNDLLINLKNKLESQIIWYKDIIMNLTIFANRENNLKTDSNPAWFSIKSRNIENEKSLNYKMYLTIPVKEYSFIKYLLELSKKLDNLAIQTSDNISLKVPYNLLWFLTHNDSIVIHFKNINNMEDIEQILNEWMKNNSINEEKRNLWRTKFAIDSENTSFSNLVAENISKWLKDNYWKYDDKVLVDLAVKYAIEAGQRAPKING